MRGTSQVYQRSIITCTARLWQSRLTGRTSARLLRSAMIMSAAMGTETHPARRHTSRGYYGTYLPPERTTATMFAPCLLGCRGTARQRPVPCGSESRGQPHSPAGSRIIRHQEVFSNTLSSGLLICGHVGPVAGFLMAIQMTIACTLVMRCRTVQVYGGYTTGTSSVHGRYITGSAGPSPDRAASGTLRRYGAVPVSHPGGGDAPGHWRPRQPRRDGAG
jgi:hypothetical protein